MLLVLLAIVSSTALLAGAISAVAEQNAGFQGFVGICLAFVLAATNFIIVQKAGLRLASITSAKPDAVQNWYGKAFCLVIMVWTVCAGFIGFSVAKLVRSFFR